jgi:hypothetical protein
MKNVLRFTLAALALVGLMFTDAEARRVQKELGWNVADITKPDGAFNTLFVPRPIASETPDTTGIFSLQDVQLIGGRNGGDVGNFSSQDSILVGWVVLYTDSTADGASTLTAITASIDASGDGLDWATVQTMAQAAASDDPVVTIPLWLRPGLSQQANLVSAPKLRIRFATATGLLLSARAVLIYWAED